MSQDRWLRVGVTAALAVFTAVVVAGGGVLVGGHETMVLGAVMGMELAVVPLVYVLLGWPDLW